jgi:hypothetical protein
MFFLLPESSSEGIRHLSFHGQLPLQLPFKVGFPRFQLPVFSYYFDWDGKQPIVQLLIWLGQKKPIVQLLLWMGRKTADCSVTTLVGTENSRLFSYYFSWDEK